MPKPYIGMLASFCLEMSGFEDPPRFRAQSIDGCFHKQKWVRICWATAMQVDWSSSLQLGKKEKLWAFPGPLLCSTQNLWVGHDQNDPTILEHSNHALELLDWSSCTRLLTLLCALQEQLLALPYFWWLAQNNLLLFVTYSVCMYVGIVHSDSSKDAASWKKTQSRSQKLLLLWW